MKKIAITLIVLGLNLTLSAGDHKHHAGVFLGMTNNTHLEHTDFTIGADYEYRISKMFGGGVIADFVLAEHMETLIMAGVFVHPLESLKIIVGNGLAFAEGMDENGDSTTESHYVFRLGAAYDFHVKNITISPTVNWDSIEGHSSIAYGVTIGFGF